MNILGILKGLVAAVMALFVGFSGTPTAPQVQQITEVASSTDAVMRQVTADATTTAPTDIQHAYDLGKAVGRLQQQVEQIKSQPTTTMQENSTADAPTQQPSTTAPAATPAPQTTAVPAAAVPASKARLVIVSPISGKGLGRQYVASSSIQDESNYIELGGILYDDAGDAVSNNKVTITATDDLQNAIQVGTGDVMSIYVNGEKRQVPVYSFHYEFKTPGDHIITFTADSGQSASVALSVK